MSGGRAGWRRVAVLGYVRLTLSLLLYKVLEYIIDIVILKFTQDTAQYMYIVYYYYSIPRLKDKK